MISAAGRRAWRFRRAAVRYRLRRVRGLSHSGSEQSAGSGSVGLLPACGSGPVGSIPASSASRCAPPRSRWFRSAHAGRPQRPCPHTPRHRPMRKPPACPQRLVQVDTLRSAPGQPVRLVTGLPGCRWQRFNEYGTATPIKQADVSSQWCSTPPWPRTVHRAGYDRMLRRVPGHAGVADGIAHLTACKFGELITCAPRQLNLRCLRDCRLARRTWPGRVAGCPQRLPEVASRSSTTPP